MSTVLYVLFMSLVMGCIENTQVTHKSNNASVTTSVTKCVCLHRVVPGSDDALNWKIYEPTTTLLRTLPSLPSKRLWGRNHKAYSYSSPFFTFLEKLHPYIHKCIHSIYTVCIYIHYGHSLSHPSGWMESKKLKTSDASLDRCFPDTLF